MKKKIFIISGIIIFIIIAAVITGILIYRNTEKCSSNNSPEVDEIITAKKPIIYLYPDVPTEVSVKLSLNGTLDYSYPKYLDGWNVTAYPDGKIINHVDDKEYSYLFWEGRSDVTYDFSKGFVVAGYDTEKFLQETLSYMGLTPKEYNEFIVYWLPQMQDNPYNLITFQGAAYTENAKLEITPEPDTIARIFMAYQYLEQPVELPEQELKTFERKGFTVVEWGGCEVK